MDIFKTGAYMILWAVGFVAVKSLTDNTMGKVQGFIGGSQGVA